MQLQLTVFALQQLCINEETCELAWETLEEHAIAAKARRAQKELLASNSEYTLRVEPVKRTVTL